MKYLLICIALLVALTPALAQDKQTSTYILLRHAEKDTTQGSDPGLTPAGSQRAQRLVGLLPNARPDEMYATPYKRTRQTLEPWATVLSKTIQVYNGSQLIEFADMLKQKKGKTIVVAGHSNTTPILANLLLGEEKYRELADDEYNKIFVITISGKKARANVISY